MRYQLREMTVDDIATVVEGEMAVFGHTLGFDMIYTDLTLNPYAHYVVLEVDRKVSGYMGLWIEDRAQIINFYVDDEYRGMGFGSMMMDFAVKLCEMSRVKNITLEVRPSNITAIHLYEKYGFKPIHTRPHYYQDGEDAIVMEKEVEEHS